jgi:hypothetical protein
LTERAALAIVGAKEGNHHDEKNARRAAPALRIDDCDGREWNRADCGRADDAVGVCADRPRSVRSAVAGTGVRFLPLVLRIAFIRDPGPVPGALRFRVRADLLNWKQTNPAVFPGRPQRTNGGIATTPKTRVVAILRDTYCTDASS